MEEKNKKDSVINKIIFWDFNPKEKHNYLYGLLNTLILSLFIIFIFYLLKVLFL